MNRLVFAFGLSTLCFFASGNPHEPARNPTARFAALPKVTLKTEIGGALLCARNFLSVPAAHAADGCTYIGVSSSEADCAQMAGGWPFYVWNNFSDFSCYGCMSP